MDQTKPQIGICKEHDPKITNTIHGCMKDGKYFWYGPGCVNYSGVCPMYKKFGLIERYRDTKS